MPSGSCWSGSRHVYAHDGNPDRSTRELDGLVSDRRPPNSSATVSRLPDTAPARFLARPAAPCGACQMSMVHVLNSPTASHSAPGPSRSKTASTTSVTISAHGASRRTGFLAGRSSRCLTTKAYHMYVDACAEAVSPLDLAHCLEVPEMTEVLRFILPNSASHRLLSRMPSDELVAG